MNAASNAGKKKLNKAEEEWRKNAAKGGKPEGVGLTLEF